MSQQSISIDEKQKLFEFQKLFKISPSQITPEIYKFITETNDKAWKIAKDQRMPLETRTATYDIIKICHEILGRKWEDSWRPKENKKSFTKRVITVQERISNCDEFVKYLANRKIEDPTVTVISLAMIWSGQY